MPLETIREALAGLRRRQAALHPDRRLERRRDLRRLRPPSGRDRGGAAAARASTTGQVIAVVQPHRYTRLPSCSTSSRPASTTPTSVIVADAYAAGEQPIDGVDRDALVQRPEGARPPPRAAARRARRHRRHRPRASPSRATTSSSSGAGNITNWAYALPGELAALDGASDDRRGAHERRRRRSARDAARRRVPGLRGRSSRTRRSRRLIWFRVGGPARGAVRAGRRGRPRRIPRGLPAGRARHGDRPRLQPAGARRRRRRAS